MNWWPEVGGGLPQQQIILTTGDEMSVGWWIAAVVVPVAVAIAGWFWNRR